MKASEFLRGYYQRPLANWQNHGGMLKGPMHQVKSSFQNLYHLFSYNLGTVLGIKNPSSYSYHSSLQWFGRELFLVILQVRINNVNPSVCLKAISWFWESQFWSRTWEFQMSYKGRIFAPQIPSSLSALNLSRNKTSCLGSNSQNSPKQKPWNCSQKLKLYSFQYLHMGLHHHFSRFKKKETSPEVVRSGKAL